MFALVAQPTKNAIVFGGRNENSDMQKRASPAAAFVAVLMTLGALFVARSGPVAGASKVSENVVACRHERNGQVGREVSPGRHATKKVRNATEKLRFHDKEG